MNIKKAYGIIAAILVISVSVLLFSCSVNDSPASEEPASLTPEQQLAELLIKDDAVWTDFDNYDIHKHLRVWNFNSDGTMEYMMFGSAETNGDYSLACLNGTWKVVSDIPDQWGFSGEKLMGVEVEMKLTHTGHVAERLVTFSNDDLPAIRDTLLVHVEGNHVKLLWMSDVDKLFDTTVHSPMLQSWLSDLWDTVKDAATYVYDNAKDAISELADEVGKDIDAIKSFIEQIPSTVQAVLPYVIEQLKEKGLDALNVVMATLSDVMDCFIPLDLAHMDIDPDLSDWMANVADGRKIRDLSIPGTHDSFTFTLNPLVGTVTGKTQFYDIPTQWAAGVRCFDFRLDRMSSADKAVAYANSGGDLGLFHGPIFLRTVFRNALEEISDLLKKHPTETCIIVLKFEGNSSYPEDIAQEAEKVNRVTNPTPDMTLGDCRGKIIFIMRYDCDKQYKVGIRANDWPGKNDTTTLTFDNDGNVTAPFMVQDHYCPDDLMEEYIKNKENLIQDNLRDAANPKQPGTWHVNQISGYMGVVNYALVASSLVPSTASYLDTVQRGHPCGIIVMDLCSFKGLYDVTASYVDCSELPGIIVNNNYTY